MTAGRLRDAIAGLCATAVPGSPPTGAELDRSAAALADTRHPLDAQAYTVATARWLADLDHRCEHPDRVATALLDHLGTLFVGASLRTGEPSSDLLAGVRTHATEPPPDVMVLSDTLLHVVGDDLPHDHLAHIDELCDHAVPAADSLHAADSIFYTPEARSSLEGFARLNLARTRQAMSARNPQPTGGPR
ncbi:hypothetical protein [Pseudonocardia endophytica]|uniref:Uncharacterized protein n=1 Tax=Pseudonocardia endophytica TaxID=401976 RepID=A0A4V2PJA0_PSEEN|nr:hypothetical protein [Pseudonocardia endophytica]TCK27636.1 hypothetical protein EV378_3508 [Pseudonocardia endophytica]